MRAIGRGLAWLYVALRHVILLVVIGAAVWMGFALPSIPSGGSVSLRSLVPEHSIAMRAEEISAKRFAFPLITRTMIVVRDPNGLSLAREVSLVRLATNLSQGHVAGFHTIEAAYPVPNVIAPPEIVRDRNTTALLYLYFNPKVSSFEQTRIAQRLLREKIGRRPGETVGVTGEVPALTKQGSLIAHWLPWVELATILLVAVAVGLHFRALGAAAIAVGAVLAAYVIAERLVELVAKSSGISVPSVAGPVIVVLVFGVATDYAIFFTSRFRALLEEGTERREAGRLIVRQILPIIFFAGLTVGAGTGSLVVSNLKFLRGFGPGLAIAVAIAMLVAAMFVPAALTIGGERLFWPAHPGGEQSERGREQRPSRFSPAHIAARHPLIAVLFALLVVGGGASGIVKIALGDDVVQGLPASSEPRRAYNAALAGFTPGALAPAVVVVSGHGVGYQRAALTRLQQELAKEPDVVEVLGPEQQPFARAFGITITPSRNDARYLLLFGSPPLQPKALSSAEHIQSSLPAAMKRAGLHSAQGLLGGDTALSAEVVKATVNDLGSVTPTMLAAIFLVIAVFLRALVAPAYLVLTSILAVLASFGITGYVMVDLLGYGSLTYYWLFTTVVLLVALGSDYNVFMVGRIWQEGRRRPLTDAIEVAAARAARPISTAGLVLALAFAAIAIVPVQAFREIAFTMAVGLLVDAFVVRPVLVPALISMVGRRSSWPSGLLRGDAPKRSRGLPASASAGSAEADSAP